MSVQIRSLQSRPIILTGSGGQAFNLEIRVQVRTDLLMGYWYNGDYSGLLIRQIRVQIPGDPLTPHRTNGSGRHILSVEIRVRLPLG